VSVILGNSGAPRWYENDLAILQHYIEHLRRCGAAATEIVLHHGPADEFTSRVHVLRDDWERVITAYRDAGISVYFHGSLTPEFAVGNWASEPGDLLERYDPILRAVAEVAADQGRTTLVIHGSGDPSCDLVTNERITAEFLSALSERLGGYSSDAGIAIELRAEKESRPTAAATSRESVERIVHRINSPLVGICWDVAHDFENTLAGHRTWESPDDEFLNLVSHVHVHDIGDDGQPHCPPTTGRVPTAQAVKACDAQPAIMEIRWRMAERIGRPWDVLRESYEVVRTLAADRETV
jgi:sugar phosphate isomerase/epimerase